MRLQRPLACTNGCGEMMVEPSFVKEEGGKKRLVSVTFSCQCGRVVRRMASGGRGNTFVVEPGEVRQDA